MKDMFKLSCRLIRAWPSFICPLKRNYCGMYRKDKFEIDDPLIKILRSKASSSQQLRFDAIIDEYKELKLIQSEGDPNLSQLIQEDLKKLNTRLENLEEEVIDELANDEFSESCNVILELYPGVGGHESMLFTRELFQIYLKYVKYHDWLLNSVEDDFTELGGLRHASITIYGKNCFRYLRHEAGVHRVQRIPLTEKHGRIHTSTTAVNILPLRDVNINIKSSDLKIQTTTSSGPGGQHVNKKETCVQITHLPTNIIVFSEETRSQETNKKTALNKLKAILMRRESEKHYNESCKLKKEQCGDLGRGEKIRTYNFPQSRITDHRLNKSFYNIKDFINGEPTILHDIIVKLEQKHKQSLIKYILEKNK